MENMRTVCVGRFLIDVPAQAEVRLSRERLAGFEVETVEESEQAFAGRLAAREADIEARAAGAGADGPGGMLHAHALDIPGMTGRTLVYGRERSYGFEKGRRVDVEWVSVEAHGHVGGLSFTLSMTHGSEAKAVEAEALLARLRLRAENDIPQASGFCIGRAVFVEPLPAHKSEHIALHLGLPEHPDVVLAFASMPGGGSDAGLLERVAETDAAADAEELLHVTRLRMEKRSINGLPGEEVLERFRELNFATTYAFLWEVRGSDDDPLQPFLSLELQGGVSPRPGGKPVDTSLHEDAVVALWDRISASVRLRPSGPALADRALALAPGARASAGDSCPQSGWWRCDEGGPGIEVQGGRVEYMRKDQRMPQALLIPRRTIWQQLRGIQARTEAARPSEWTLVEAERAGGNPE
jgi:hypothetical protein